MRSRVFPALILSAALACGVAACNRNSAGSEIGLDVAAMDTSLQAGNDFYGYSNGAWQRNTEIPADRSSIGSFYRASLATEHQVTELVTGIAGSNPEAGTDQARIANYYNAYINTAAIDAAGMAPAQADLARFNAINNRTDLSRVLGEQIRADVDPLNATNFFTEDLFGVFVTQGLATPGEVIPYILQGGLGLPEREYYLSNDPSMVEIRGQYRAYIEQLLTAAGIADARAKAQRIFDLETQIARAHVTREQSENIPESAAVWTRAELAQRAPGIDWNAFLTAAQLGNQQRFAAYHAQAITRLSALVASQPLQAWKDWLAFHQINSHADVLPTAIDQAHFGFYGTTLSGTPQQRERARRALDSLDVNLGDAVGHAYVEHYFPASAREECKAWSRTSRRRSANAFRVLNGWRTRRALKRFVRSKPSLSASAIPTHGATIRTTKCRRPTRTPTLSMANARNMLTSSRNSVTRWIAMNGG